MSDDASDGPCPQAFSRASPRRPATPLPASRRTPGSGRCSRSRRWCPRGQGAAVRLSVRRQPQLYPARRGRRLVRRIARPQRRAAAPKGGHRNPQGPDRRPELRGASASARRHAGPVEEHRRRRALSRPPRPAPFVRRLAQDAGRGDAGHRCGDHLSAIRQRRLALFARHHRWRDDQALDREDGRAPEAPDPAYQQILKGVPAADFSADELIYLPRNLRAHRVTG